MKYWPLLMPITQYLKTVFHIPYDSKIPGKCKTQF